ncbi:flavin reductase family protein [Luedemannella helvata]|uniref:Flavin reductase like domain-containing protein n=1 Tax=Luedemannella helvata TaxID=349315 RepID=A0ABP4WMV5_9ACTN
MTIHYTDPFATPEPERSPVRRLRGRLPSAVALWTADGRGGPVGLTVSSTMVVEGQPGRLLGVLDPESDLAEALAAAGARARFAVVPLAEDERQLADRFAGLMPAPGGVFAGEEWLSSGYGPVLAGPRTWAGAEVAALRPLGWGVLVEAEIGKVSVVDAPSRPLVHFRGRYRTIV